MITRQQEQFMECKIKEATILGVLNYLKKKPYEEVAMLINEIQKEVAISKSKEDGSKR